MKPNTQEKLLKTYNEMREAVKTAWHEAEEKTLPTLKQALEKAEQKASDLGELSREEIHKLSDYLQRDIHDAAYALSDNGKQLADWLEFDLDLAEAKFGEWVAKVANGEEHTIRKCIRCLGCLHRLRRSLGLRCEVNREVGQERYNPAYYRLSAPGWKKYCLP